MDDRTARARIRDAAIECFADSGVAGTSVREIAGRAGVSAGLVMHHFGSKDNLRVACDEHVAATIRSQKGSAMGQGAAFDPVSSLRASAGGPPLIRYLARTLVDGSPHVAELVDELVEDAIEYIELGVTTGLIMPSDRPRERAIVLTLWSLGSVVLHEHVERLLGVDMTADLTADPKRSAPYVQAVLDLLTGFITPTTRELLTQAFGDGQETR
ncbi:MAG: TetR family transcriptional regulator [Acidimicrobiia bacterium]|nr:TetR family transcriptional regulator [Acidimicrobiia bacterium]MDH4307491.1 TetR family transcriptional regulator [Acidimicrobiia bacterium]MDH5294938.1 TetR family transcriptional regulator [Acidimicrobiia bacterium]